MLAGQERALHRVREELLLLVETRVVDGERRLAGDREGGGDGRRVDRTVGVERDERQRREHLRRRRDRQDDRRRALLEERAAGGRAARRARRSSPPPIRSGVAVAKDACERARERTGPHQEGAQRLGEARVRDAQRLRLEVVAALVGRTDHRGVDREVLDERVRHGVERPLERERLRERAGDGVERADLGRRLPLLRERLLALAAEALRLLVQLRVLHGDGELRGERAQQRLLVRRQRALRGRDRARRAR